MNYRKMNFENLENNDFRKLFFIQNDKQTKQTTLFNQKLLSSSYVVSFFWLNFGFDFLLKFNFIEYKRHLCSLSLYILHSSLLIILISIKKQKQIVYSIFIEIDQILKYNSNCNLINFNVNYTLFCFEFFVSSFKFIFYLKWKKKKKHKHNSSFSLTGISIIDFIVISSS